MNNKKLVLKWCLITFSVLLMITMLIFFILCMCTPLTMAKICNDLGFEKAETSFYLKDYKKNKNISSLYKYVVNSYNLKNYKDVEEYYEKLESNDRYLEFIDYVNEQNLKVNATKLNKSALLNEDNYLKNRYVISLINNNKLDKAFDYACTNFKNYKNYTIKNSGVYLFYNLVGLNNETINNKFLENNGFEDTLYNVLIDYVNLSIDEFDDSFEEFVESDSIYFLALNTRIKQVYFNIHTLSNKLNLTEPSGLFERVSGVNDKAVKLL